MSPRVRFPAKTDGGHYVPNTVAAIERGNAGLPAASDLRIHLVGFAVGNGYTDWKLDFNMNVPNGRYRARIERLLHQPAALLAVSQRLPCV